MTLNFDPAFIPVGPLPAFGGVGVDTIANGVPTGSDPAPATFVDRIAPLTLTTNAGNTEVSLDGLRVEISDPSQIDDTGVFDLGLSGQVPYSIRFDTYFWEADSSPTPLAIDGSFELPLIANISGSVEIGASVVPFSLRFETVRGSVVGDLDALGGGEFQLTLDGDLVGSFTNPPDPDRTIELGNFNGADLALRLRSQGGFDAAGTATVPEPATGILMAAVLLAAWRGRRGAKPPRSTSPRAGLADAS